MEVNNNLESSFASSDVKELIKASFELMKTAEKNKNLYKDPKNVTYIKNLIDIYYRQVNPSYEKLAEMFTKFRKTYIDTESIVEKNNTKEEKEGLSTSLGIGIETTANSSPIEATTPSSSNNSRLTHSSPDSPASSLPPGYSQPPPCFNLAARLIKSTLPSL